MRILLILSEHAGGLHGGSTNVLHRDEPAGDSDKAGRMQTYTDLQQRLLSACQAVVPDGSHSVDLLQYESVTLDGLQPYDALVLSGSFEAWDMHNKQALESYLQLLRQWDRPLLGICAGMQLIVWMYGGEAACAAAVHGTVGPETVSQVAPSPLAPPHLLSSCSASFGVIENHRDEVLLPLPAGLCCLASSASCAVEVITADQRPCWYGTQFHPELYSEDCPEGGRILEQFTRQASEFRDRQMDPSPESPVFGPSDHWLGRWVPEAKTNWAEYLSFYGQQPGDPKKDAMKGT